MNLSESMRSALQAIRAHKLRSFLTLLGVIIGVTTIGAVVGVVSGLNSFVEKGISQMAPDVYEVSRFGILESIEDFMRALKRRPITYEEYLQLSGMLQKARQICAKGETLHSISAGRHRITLALIQGQSGNWARVFKDELSSGRPFNEADEATGQHVAMIGSKISEELFPGRDPIGREILVGGVPFRVIGLYAAQGRGINPNIPDERVFIPLRLLRRNLLSTESDISLYIKAEGGPKGVEASIDELRAALRALRHTSFNAPDPFGVVSPEILMKFWKKISRAAFLLLTLMASVSLVVGGIVIMNIMLVSVVERTPEIGIRRATGARKRDIRIQFLLESSLLSLGGGVIGVVLGWLVTFVVRHAADFPAQTTPLIVLMSLSISCLVGIAAGFLPARRASNLAVIDAIRSE